MAKNGVREMCPGATTSAAHFLESDFWIVTPKVDLSPSGP